jgi:hypothetical protein
MQYRSLGGLVVGRCTLLLPQRRRRGICWRVPDACDVQTRRWVLIRVANKHYRANAASKPHDNMSTQIKTELECGDLLAPIDNEDYD